MKTPREVVEMRVSGRVQGVGFRYFAYHAARDLGIKGWVKNMPDGTVLIQAEGAPEDMDRFRKKFHKGPVFGRVDDLVETRLSEEKESRWADFQITY